MLLLYHTYRYTYGLKSIRSASSLLAWVPSLVSYIYIFFLKDIKLLVTQLTKERSIFNSSGFFDHLDSPISVNRRPKRLRFFWSWKIPFIKHLDRYYIQSLWLYNEVSHSKRTCSHTSTHTHIYIYIYNILFSRGFFFLFFYYFFLYIYVRRVRIYVPIEVMIVRDSGFLLITFLNLVI